MDFFKAFQVRSDSHFRKITLKDDRWIRRGKIKARVSYITTQFYIYTHLFDEYLGWQATLCQVWAKIVAMVMKRRWTSPSSRGGEPKDNGHTYGHNRHQLLKWEMVPGFWQVVDHTVCIIFLKIKYKHFALSLQTRTLNKNALWEYLSVAENSSVSIQPRQNQWNHSISFTLISVKAHTIYKCPMNDKFSCFCYHFFVVYNAL